MNSICSKILQTKEKELRNIQQILLNNFKLNCNANLMTLISAQIFDATNCQILCAKNNANDINIKYTKNECWTPQQGSKSITINKLETLLKTTTTSNDKQKPPPPWLTSQYNSNNMIKLTTQQHQNHNNQNQITNTETMHTLKILIESVCNNNINENIPETIQQNKQIDGFTVNIF